MKKIMILLLAIGLLFVSVISLFANPKTNFNNKRFKFNIRDEIRFTLLEKYSVSVISEGIGLGRCSGVLIDKDEHNSYALTCKHCISISEDNYVEDKRVRIIVVSARDDLAYLIADGNIEDKEPVKMADEKAKRKDKVYYLGYPEFGETYKSKGDIDRYTTDWGYSNLTSVDGCSGGGIFNKDKELIGILWGKLILRDVAIFEPITDVKIFLEEIKQYLK